MSKPEDPERLRVPLQESGAMDLKYEIDVQIASTPGEFGELLSAYDAFVGLTDVNCGLWCHPRVLRHTAYPIKDTVQFVLCTLALDAQPVAMLPFKLQTIPLALSVGLARLGAASARVLRLPDAEFAVRGAGPRGRLLAAALCSLASRAMSDVVFVDDCRFDEKGQWDAGKECRSAVLRNIQRTFLVTMPDSFDAYLAQLNPKSRQTLKRKARRVREAAGGALRIEAYRGPAEMDELAGLLQQVWNKSWHGRLNRQPPPPPGLLDDLARQGWVRSYVLFAGDTPIASVVGYQYEGTYFDEAPAFDNEWSRYSPGLVLFMMVFEDLFQRDTPHEVDFGFGYNQYKEVLGTRSEIRGQVWLPITLRGKTVVSAQRACDGLHRIGKAMFRKTGAVRGAKRALQGK